MEPRILLIGLGSIGQRHLDTLLDLDYGDIVAVDTRTIVGEARVPILDTVERAGEWLRTHAIICTPPEFHYHHALWCLKNGIHVFIEKPMTATKVEAETLCDMATRRGLLLAVGYMERAHPTVQQTNAWVADHRPVRGMVVCNWRAMEKTYPLDVLAESSHAIDTALYLFGKPDAVKQFKAKTSATCKFSWEDGREVTVAMNMAATVAERVIQIADDDDNALSAVYGFTQNEWDICYRLELQAFLEGKPLCTGDDGLAVMEVMEGLV